MLLNASEEAKVGSLIGGEHVDFEHLENFLEKGLHVQTPASQIGKIQFFKTIPLHLLQWQQTRILQLNI